MLGAEVYSEVDELAALNLTLVRLNPVMSLLVV